MVTHKKCCQNVLTDCLGTPDFQLNNFEEKAKFKISLKHNFVERKVLDSLLDRIIRINCLYLTLPRLYSLSNIANCVERQCLEECSNALYVKSMFMLIAGSFNDNLKGI